MGVYDADGPAGSNTPRKPLRGSAKGVKPSAPGAKQPFGGKKAAPFKKGKKKGK